MVFCFLLTHTPVFSILFAGKNKVLSVYTFFVRSEFALSFISNQGACRFSVYYVHTRKNWINRGETMMISLVRLFLWILCISLPMTNLVFAAESEFSKNLSIAENSENGLRDRILAINYLGISGELQALKPMLAILMNEKEEDAIRCAAVRASADLDQGRPQVLSGFEKVYRQKGSGDNLRYTILFSLGRMRAGESLPLLSDALVDPDEMIRFKASQALGLLGNEAATALLMSHLNEEQDRMVRAEMVRALDGAKYAGVRKKLIETLLTDPSSLVRWNAALMLEKMEPLSKDTRSAMAPALNDASPMVRKTVKGILQ